MFDFEVEPEDPAVEEARREALIAQNQAEREAAAKAKADAERDAKLRKELERHEGSEFD